MNFYQALGVAPSATDEQIKAAYDKLSTELRPLAGDGNVQAREQLAEVEAAYRAIGDRASRSAYNVKANKAASELRARPARGSVEAAKQKLYETRRKSVGLAMALGLLFGPLGVLYASVVAAVVCFILTILLVSTLPLLVSSLIMGIVCCISAGVMAGRHNERVQAEIEFHSRV